VELSGGLLERDDVIASVDRLVSDLAPGSSGALFVLAEAGLGKTSAINHACRQAAAAGLAVGFGRGHPMETSLPFGLLAQALDGVGERDLLREGGPGQATADDRAARFYGVLRWLQDRSGSALLLALDDLLGRCRLARRDLLSLPPDKPAAADPDRQPAAVAVSCQRGGR